MPERAKPIQASASGIPSSAFSVREQLNELMESIEQAKAQRAYWIAAQSPESVIKQKQAMIADLQAEIIALQDKQLIAATKLEEIDKRIISMQMQAVKLRNAPEIQKLLALAEQAKALEAKYPGLLERANSVKETI